MKPFSEACERNKEPIVNELLRLFAGVQQVLEIGSGTGQHAAYFALKLPHLRWQPSDLALHHVGIEAWIRGSRQENIDPPLELDVTHWPWPELQVQAVFSANTLHIISWAAVQAFFKGVGALLPSGGLLVVYGPFNEGGQFTSPSNEAFDAFLKRRDPLSGLRDRAELEQVASSQGLQLVEQHDLPNHNRLLVWEKN